MPILPASGMLTKGQSLQFTLTDAAGIPLVIPPGGVVTWSVSPAAGAGTIDPNGLFTAPSQIAAPATASITGTAPAPNGQTGTATVELVPPAVILVPANVDLRAGDEQEFSATVPGDAASAVTWNIAPSLGTIAN